VLLLVLSLAGCIRGLCGFTRCLLICQGRRGFGIVAIALLPIEIGNPIPRLVVRAFNLRRYAWRSIGLLGTLDLSDRRGRGRLDLVVERRWGDIGLRLCCLFGGHV
jgi:hypothetical protein